MKKGCSGPCQNLNFMAQYVSLLFTMINTTVPQHRQLRRFCFPSLPSVAFFKIKTRF